MAQLVERLLQIPEFRGSNPVINQQLYWTLCTVNCIQKTKIKEKESGNCPFKKSIWEVVISQIFWECSERLLPGVPNPANAEDLNRHRRKQENLKNLRPDRSNRACLWKLLHPWPRPDRGLHLGWKHETSGTKICCFEKCLNMMEYSWILIKFL